MVKKSKYYPGLGWSSPPGDEDGPPDCPDCGRHMQKLYLRRRFYRMARRKWLWSGFWYCSDCESIDTSGAFGNMKYESDHHSPEDPADQFPPE